ncbi:MAG: hypothetical protein ABIY51_01930, partial [Ferruginibacter sp.]
MSALNITVILILLFLIPFLVYAQEDSVIGMSKNSANKFIRQAENKMDIYEKRLTGRTKKTLTKLARWEHNIQNILKKADPALATQLFSQSTLSFQKMLEQYNSGEAMIANQVTIYDGYRDKLNTSLQYLQQQKDLIDSSGINSSIKKVDDLEKTVSTTDALQQMIKERKAALMQACLKAAGKSRYLAKISKETFYYTETLRNYKELFSDSKKAEKVALNLLNKIPAFQKFSRENSAIASLFGNNSGGGQVANLTGLQTRASVEAMVQSRIVAGGPNAMDLFKQQVNEAQAEMNKL